MPSDVYPTAVSGYRARDRYGKLGHGVHFNPLAAFILLLFYIVYQYKTIKYLLYLSKALATVG